MTTDALTPAVPSLAPPNGSARAAQSHGRVKVIDGWRAIAALFVVVTHATNYRFVDQPGAALHFVRQLSGPLAEIGVQLFFVISGYIITSLLARERDTRGSISIAAFYVRRLCRIVPPLLVYYLAIVALAHAGAIRLPPSSLLASATFTCNTGLVDCDWWVAHTWSLAVEEQFYIVWPLLFGLVAAGLHVRLLTAVVAISVIGALVQQPTFHGNFTSFGCIAAGALYANSPTLRDAVSRAGSTPLWLASIAALIFAFHSQAAPIASAVMPLMIVYIIFAGSTLGWVRWTLESRPLQLVGLGSYSLYLWQQLFLARPDRYADGPLAIVLLPVVVMASVLLIERPFIRLGRRWSRAIDHRPGPGKAQGISGI